MDNEVRMQNQSRITDKNFASALLVDGTSPLGAFDGVRAHSVRIKGLLQGRVTSIAFAFWASVGFLGSGNVWAQSSTPLPSQSPSASWPNWGGDLHNTHNAKNETQITPENVSQLAVKWKYQTGGNVSATPTIIEDTVYVPDWGLPYGLNQLPWGGGSMHAIDKETGNRRWRTRISQYGGARLNDTSRTSPVVFGDLLIFGDFINVALPPIGKRKGSGATLFAIDKRDGHLVWKTTIDAHPLAQITQSPTLFEGKVYVGVSSQEETANTVAYDCCTFRGSFASLDAATGALIWKKVMTPVDTKFTGVAVWGSSPAIDEKRRSVYIATGNNYTLPQVLDDCLKKYAGDLEKQKLECLDIYDVTDNLANSIVALDLDTGNVRFASKMQNTGGWTFSCPPQSTPGASIIVGECLNPTSQDEDFAQAPMLVTTSIDGVSRDLLVAGQKSGFVFGVDADNGNVVWSTVAGPGSGTGGVMFGQATDGQRAYFGVTNGDHKEYQLVAGPHAGEKIKGGLWTSIDLATGHILWQTPDPTGSEPLTGSIAHPLSGLGKGEGSFALPMGGLTVANGVLFGGSLARKGPMYAFEAATGAILWTFESGGSVVSAPAIVDGVVYWGSGYQNGRNNNKVFAFSLPK